MLLSLLAAAALSAVPAQNQILTLPLVGPPKPAIRAFSCQTSHPLPTPVQQAPVGRAPKLTPFGTAPLHSLGAEPDAAMLRPVLRINHCNDADVLRLNVSDKNAPQQRGR